MIWRMLVKGPPPKHLTELFDVLRIGLRLVHPLAQSLRPPPLPQQEEGVEQSVREKGSREP